MPSTRRTAWLASTLLLLVGLGTGLYLVTESGESGRGSLSAPTVAPAGAQPVARAAGAKALVPPPALEVRSGEDPDTTVLWPLRLEIELLRAAYLPEEPGVPPVGSGATARLVGRITDVRNEGARATVSFVAGPNIGRALQCDVTGAFGATDLYPGLSIVEVTGPGTLGSRREVRLRQDREAQLNIGYGRPAQVMGRVIDPDGEAVEGASVTVDGQSTVTGPEGEFYLASVAGGQVLAEIEKEGFAAFQGLAYVTAGKLVPKEQMTFALRPSSTLRISAAQNIGGPGPIQVVLLPQGGGRVTAQNAHRNERFPWHRLNPIEVWPGQPRTVEGLPNEVIRVLGFRAGASIGQKVVNLRGDRPYDVQLQLEPAPAITGKVMLDGKPIDGALVRLEAPNRVRATLSHFREPSYFLETEVMPAFPPAVQEVESGPKGRFVLTAWADTSAVRFLEARGPSGRTWAGRLVHPGEEVFELELEEVDLGDAELVVDFPDRWQGLPVEVLVDGAPFDPEVVPAHDELRIKDLRAGEWRLKASWHGQPVHDVQSLRIDGVTHVEVPLPQEAIQGQDEEAWLRAGRDYPYDS